MNEPDDRPALPLPPRSDDVTLLQHGTLPPPSRVPSTSVPPVDLPDRAPSGLNVQAASTGARVALPAMEDSSRLNPLPQLDKSPVPLSRRPIMPPAVGASTAKQFAGQHSTVDPAQREQDQAVLRPIRPQSSDARPPVNVTQEGSDLIQTFLAGPDDAHPGMPFAASPQKTIPPGSGMTIPPPGKILRHGPPAPVHPREAAVQRQGVVQGMHLPATAPGPVVAAPHAGLPGVLPLHTDQVVALILEHRRRNKALDTWARVLEVTAVVAGLVAMIALPLGHWGLALGLGLAGVALAAQGTTLRHVAHTSAQVSALLDALSGGHGP